MNVGISTKLFLLCAIVSLALLLMAGYSAWGLNDVTRNADRTERVRVPQGAAMSQMELAITRASLQLRHAMLARNEQEREAALKDILAKREHFEVVMRHYEQGLFTPKGKAQFARLPPTAEAFWQVAGNNIQLVVDGKIPEAFAFLVERTIPARNALLEVLAEGVAYQNAALKGDIDRIRSQVGLLSWVLPCLAVLTSVLLMGAAAWLSRELKARVAHASAIAQRVRDGDLASPVVDDRRDEFSTLLQALDHMKQGLGNIVVEVRSSAQGVSTAVSEIARGNHDLSSRTDQQSASLEQTSASTRQLGDLAQQNAQSAITANQLAHQASEIAGKGGGVVSEVVTTMADISASSHRISDIIGVIDGIAFQTNILALNAAVEAARAGEQGRGFAVVASEVRNLAQRSSAAAREIADLIQDSVSRVEHGSELVNKAGSTMQEVVASISRVRDIVGEITQASQEQNTSVVQIGQAVTEMDQTTQQNAALVEQSAAAAAALKEQADHLVASVGTFRV